LNISCVREYDYTARESASASKRPCPCMKRGGRKEYRSERTVLAFVVTRMLHEPVFVAVDGVLGFGQTGEGQRKEEAQRRKDGHDDARFCQHRITQCWSSVRAWRE
jgi:hypothetical protein